MVAAAHVRRETASDYLKEAGILSGRRAGGVAPPFKAGEWRDHRLWRGVGRFTGSQSVGRASAIHREAIEMGLSRGRNATAIHQSLVDVHGFTGSYEIVKRFVPRLCGTHSPEPSVVIETTPGEGAQVDYGTPNGARPGHRQVSSYAPVRAHARLCRRVPGVGCRSRC